MSNIVRYHITTILIPIFLSIQLQAQNEWQERGDFKGGGRSGAFSFVIDGYAYVSGGFVSGTEEDNLWRYDPQFDYWEKVRDLPFKSSHSSSFVVNSKGYVLNMDVPDTNVYMFDPSDNSWTMLADFPGERRNGAVSFHTKDYGYYGLGDDIQNSELHRSDIWRYDPLNDQWEQVSDFPINTYQSTSFNINNIPYIGLGSADESKNNKHFYQYKEEEDTWIRIADFPGNTRVRSIGFSIDGYGYITTGFDLVSNYDVLQDFWRYDPKQDLWEGLGNFPGEPRMAATAFSINDRGFVTCGYVPDFPPLYFDDVWEYSSYDGVTGWQEGKKSLLTVYPNPASSRVHIKSPGTIRSIELYDRVGILKLSQQFHSHEISLDVSELDAGLYIMRMRTPERMYESKIMKE